MHVFIQLCLTHKQQIVQCTAHCFYLLLFERKSIMLVCPLVVAEWFLTISVVVRWFGLLILNFLTKYSLYLNVICSMPLICLEMKTLIEAFFGSRRNICVDDWMKMRRAICCSCSCWKHNYKNMCNRNFCTKWIADRQI